MYLTVTTNKGRVRSGSAFSILARIAALDGSGERVYDREGNCIQQADVDTITCKAYKLGDKPTNAPEGIGPDPELTPEANILDELETNGWETDEDYAGYNFRHDVPGTYCTEENTWYRFEYVITLSSGRTIVFDWLIKTE